MRQPINTDVDKDAIALPASPDFPWTSGKSNAFSMN